MAIEFPQRLDLYTWNPSRAQFENTLESGQVITLSLEVATGGLYRTVGRGIQVIGNVEGFRRGQFIGSVSTVNPAELRVLPNGRAFLSNPIDPSTIRTQRQRVGAYFEGAVAYVTLPDGSLQRMEVGIAGLTRAGQSKAVMEVNGEIKQWMDVSNAIDETTGRPAELPPGFRLATPQELIMRGLIGQIYSNQRALMNTLISAHATDENGRAISNPSDAAAFLARIASGSLQTYWGTLL